jgi:hypothetical protein
MVEKRIAPKIARVVVIAFVETVNSMMRFRILIERNQNQLAEG